MFWKLSDSCFYFNCTVLLDASSTASTTLGVLIGRVAGFSLHNKTPSRYGTYVEC